VSKILAFSWHCIDSADMHYCYIVRDVRLCVLVTTVSSAKTDEQIEMPLTQGTTYYFIPQQERHQSAEKSAGFWLGRSFAA